VHRHRVTRVLPFTPGQLFRLVGDVSAYPQFVPWITAMRVSNMRSDPGVEFVDAEATIGFSLFRERFATRVRRDRERLEIATDLLRGPFRRLKNNWKFEPHPTGCLVVFEIEFEFRSRLLDALLHANFDRAVDKLIGCFEARARELYGERQG
jgi:coenzyme Q-binding protein COQ10